MLISVPLTPLLLLLLVVVVAIITITLMLMWFAFRKDKTKQSKLAGWLVWQTQRDPEGVFSEEDAYNDTCTCTHSRRRQHDTMHAFFDSHNSG